LGHHCDPSQTCGKSLWMQGLWHLPSQQPNNIEKAKCYPQSWESVLEFCVSYSAHPVGSFHYQIIIPKYQPATGKFVVVTSHYNHYNIFLLETWQWFVSVKDYNDYNFTAMPVRWNRWKRRSPRFFAPAAPARVVASMCDDWSKWPRPLPPSSMGGFLWGIPKWRQVTMVVSILRWCTFYDLGVPLF